MNTWVNWVILCVGFAVFMFLVAEFLIWLQRVIMRRMELRHHNRIMKMKKSSLDD